jgi:hypothetical protein
MKPMAEIEIELGPDDKYKEVYDKAFKIVVIEVNGLVKKINASKNS